MRFVLMSALVALVGLHCSKPEQSQSDRIVIWHQMRPDERDILHRQLQRYMSAHPGVEVVELYKETEELRSGFVIASIAGQGPDLVYGPSDPVGIYEATSTIRALENLLPSAFLAGIDSSALLFYNGHLYQVADKVGNHLALVYNRAYVNQPPKTDRDLISLAHRIQAKYGSTSGRPNVYGLTWNYTEPFFFIPFFTGFGGWVFGPDGVTPSLNTQAMVRALEFVRSLRDVEHIIPNEADYEIADALFKDGKAAMIINGDWSWAGYRAKGLDIGVAPLPLIEATGHWCAPMTSPKGYSVNVNTADVKLPAVSALLQYLLSEECQLETVRALSTAPTLRSLEHHEAIGSDDILLNSLLQIKRGRTMPVVPEMRAIWDAMRPSYQAVMGGAKEAAPAAADMQRLAERKIRDMKE